MEPFAYKISWNDGTFYIGCRYAHNCSPEDLFTTYFTSSKWVKKHVNKYGDPDTIEILGIFESGKEARACEKVSLLTNEIYKDPKCLNRAVGMRFMIQFGRYKSDIKKKKKSKVKKKNKSTLK
jgi:hypothetical protein